jgi:hypothetical protein
MVGRGKSETSKPRAFVARAVLCMIFGFFIHETITEFNKLCGLSLNPYFAIFPTLLLYVFQEVVIRKWRANEKAIPINKPIKQKFDKVFYLIAWIIVASFFCYLCYLGRNAIQTEQL